VDDKSIFKDDSEGTPKLEMDGFIQSDGTFSKDHYYYLEWRNYAGSDKALEHSRNAKYNTGLVVWYGDESFTDNWVGEHPGEGFLGVIDAHPKAIAGKKDGKITYSQSTRYQVADAAFSFDHTKPFSLNDLTRGNYNFYSLKGNRAFDDSQTYIDQNIPDAGKILPQLGLKFEVMGEAKDNSAGLVWIHK
jgi:immune inhibitor A